MEFFLHLFKPMDSLVATSCFLGWGLHKCSKSDGGKFLEKSMGTSREAALFLGSLVQDHGKKKGQKTDESMNFDLLIRPVVLRSKSQMKGILQILESIFHLSLAPVSGDNFFFGPVMTVGNQDSAAQPVLL
jgi:hypothetical protein